MDFNKIIIDGLSNQFNKSDLKSYCEREFLKAKNEYYNHDTFFNPLLEIINVLNQLVIDEFDKELKDYNYIIDSSSKNELHVTDYNTQKLDPESLEWKEYQIKFNKEKFDDYTKRKNNFSIDSIIIDDCITTKGLKEFKKAIQEINNNPNTINTRFLIETENLPYPFAKYKEAIERDGFIKKDDDNGVIKIYDPYLLYLLTKEVIQATNLDTSEVVQLNTEEYGNSYTSGFRKGEQQFEQQFKVTPSVLYEHSEKYKKDLDFYFFEPKKELIGRTVYEKIHSFSEIVTHKLIELYGFYSGMYSSLENVLNQNPGVFNTSQLDNSEVVIPKPKNFAECLTHENKDILIKKIAELLSEEKGVRIAFVLKYLNDKKILDFLEITDKITNKGLYQFMRKQFGFVTSDESINKYTKYGFQGCERVRTKEKHNTIIENKFSDI